MKVKVGFTSENKPDFVSKTIMWFLKTNYSHVFFILGDHIFHATGKGVHPVALSEYMKTHNLVHSFEVELNMSLESFLAFMDGASSKEYSSSQYLGFLSKSLQKFVKNGNEKMICSELVAVVLEKYGAYCLPKEADFMSPRDVFNLLNEGPNHVVTSKT